MKSWKSKRVIRNTLLLSTLSLSGSIACHRENRQSEGPISGLSESMVSVDKNPPTTLAGTNLFLLDSPSEPVENLLSYQVHVPLWSDGAYKKRYLYLPPETQVTINSNDGTFNFPIGSVLIKQFMTPDETHTPIETRISVLRSDGKWKYSTYVWNNDGSAVLNDRPRVITKQGMEYRIPSETECKMCHNSDAQSSVVLGFRVNQLKTLIPGPNGYSIPQIEKLIASTKIDLTNPDALQRIYRIPGYPQPEDKVVPIETRARVYMDVNCATCHRPNGLEKANLLDLRREATDTHLISRGKLVPKDLDKSIIWHLVSGSTNRMPYLSLRPDPVGLDIIKKYIETYEK